MILSGLATVLLTMIAFWLLGGLALRLGGGLLVLAGLIGLVAVGNGDGLLVAGLGALAWLAGQVHYGLRHGTLKAPLARVLCTVAAAGWRRFGPSGRAPRPDAGGGVEPPT